MPGVWFVLAPTVTAPREARRAIATVAAEWLEQDALDHARLLVSELVTAAVCNADAEEQTPVVVKVAREDEAVRIDVSQPAPVTAVAPAGDQPAAPDRLAVVAALSDRWGYQREPPNVWFTLAA